MSRAGPAVHVVCFGNPWHGDDGFGLAVHRQLTALEPLPGAAALFDAGTAGLDALPCFDGCERAVIVDAVRTGARPGTLHRLPPGDLSLARRGFSLHDLGVGSVLAAMFEPPAIVLIGVEPGPIRPFDDGLSPPVRAAIPAAVRLVMHELCRESPRDGRPRTSG